MYVSYVSLFVRYRHAIRVLWMLWDASEFMSMPTLWNYKYT